MKKIKFISLLIVALGMSFTSCEKDEPKDDPNAPTEETDFDIFEEISYDEMVFVKGGTFTMGATEEQGNSRRYDEFPVHEVTLSDFWIGKYEVTQELWEYVMGSNPSGFSGSKYLPVENVSWLDCMDFISRLNDLTGKKFRLPTEAEWEYAARGGQKSKGYKYSGSNNLDEVAWYDGNAFFVEDDAYGTHQVGKKLPNELCLYDMSGNVYEWTGDWYDENYYSVSPSINPTGPIVGVSKVLRGGDWNSNTTCRVSFRESWGFNNHDNEVGLRLVCEK